MPDTARLAALAVFALAALWTPGPNNLLLARSGARYGIRRTVPHICGVALGFGVMLFAVALGLGEAFRAEPLIQETLRYVGAAVIFYISWRVASAPPAEEGAVYGGRPFRFHEAAAFQWINPKAWGMCISVSALYVTGVSPLFESAVCAGVFGVLGFTSAFGWTAFGERVGRILTTGRRQRVFAVTMGLLLAGCGVAMLFDDLDLG